MKQVRSVYEDDDVVLYGKRSHIRANVNDDLSNHPPSNKSIVLETTPVTPNTSALVNSSFGFGSCMVTMDAVTPRTKIARSTSDVEPRLRKVSFRRTRTRHASEGKAVNQCSVKCAPDRFVKKSKSILATKNAHIDDQRDSQVPSFCESSGKVKTSLDGTTRSLLNRSKIGTGRQGAIQVSTAICRHTEISFDLNKFRAS